MNVRINTKFHIRTVGLEKTLGYQGSVTEVTVGLIAWQNYFCIGFILLCRLCAFTYISYINIGLLQTAYLSYIW